MKTHFTIYLLIALFSVLFSSCEEVVDIDLPNMPAKLVIEGNLDFEKDSPKNIFTVKLSTTAGFYDSIIPAVNNAVVWVEDANAKIHPFTAIGNTGLYHAYDIPAVENGAYTLYVDYQNEVYTAVELLKTVPKIEEVTERKATYFNTEFREISTYFKDDESTDDNYMLRYILKDKKVQYSILGDQLTQGNLMHFKYIDDEVKSGDTLQIHLYSSSKTYYNYISKFLSVTSSGAGPFDTPTGMLRGNIKNQTSPKNFALGYFRVTQYDEAIHIIE